MNADAISKKLLDDIGHVENNHENETIKKAADNDRRLSIESMNFLLLRVILFMMILV